MIITNASQELSNTCSHPMDQRRVLIDSAFGKHEYFCVNCYSVVDGDVDYWDYENKCVKPEYR